MLSLGPPAAFPPAASAGKWHARVAGQKKRGLAEEGEGAGGLLEDAVRGRA